MKRHTLARLPPTSPFVQRTAFRLAWLGVRGDRAWASIADYYARRPGPHVVLLGGRTATTVDPAELVGRVMLAGLFERAEATLAARLAPLGGTVIDAGANLGLFTFALAEAVGLEGRVLACEPQPALAAALERGVRSTGVPVDVLQVALTDKAGTAQLSCWSGNLGGAFLTGPRAADGDRVISVSTERLDRVLATQDVRRVDLLKVDVEGAEATLLRGAGAWWHEARIPSVLLEVAPAFPEFSGLAEILAPAVAMTGSYRPYRVVYAGRFVRQPCLVPLPPDPDAWGGELFNALLLRRDVPLPAPVLLDTHD